MIEEQSQDSKSRVLGVGLGSKDSGTGELQKRLQKLEEKKQRIDKIEAKYRKKNFEGRRMSKGATRNQKQ